MYNFQSGGSSFEFGSGYQPQRPIVVLIVIQCLVFLLMTIFRGAEWIYWFGLVPRLIFEKGMVWQLLTYSFLHGGTFHLIFNMLCLWMFGVPLAARWGTRAFFAYYCYCTVAAGLCASLFAYDSFTLGASGAIFGILMAFSVLYPDAILMVFWLFPMRIRYAVWVYIGIDLLAALASPGAAAGYVAHLGGGLFGLLYIKNEGMRRFFSAYAPSAVHRRWKQQRLEQEQRANVELDMRVDAILDKISRQGLASLTKEERKILERKSRSP